MRCKGSILLLAVLTFTGACARAGTLDSELNEYGRNHDWPGIVLLLEPLKGQNFEHDLVLSRAYLSLERRADALGILSSLYSNHKDERTTKLFELAGSIFFSQETSQLYFEAIRLLSMEKYQEAKDKLEQALVKEPGHVFLLTRMVQVELMLGSKELAATHLKQAQEFAPFSNDLKLLGAKLALDQTEQDQDWAKVFAPLKNLFLQREGPALLWLEALFRSKKTVELKTVSEKLIQTHPTWSGVLVWIYKKEMLSVEAQKKLKGLIDKNLKDKEEFNQTLDRELKLDQYLWAGMVSYPALLKQMTLVNQVK